MNVYSNLLSLNSAIFLFRSTIFTKWHSTKIDMQRPFADDRKQMKFDLL